MRSGLSSTYQLLVAVAFIAGAAPTTRADLTYEFLNGASLIYDSTTKVTWTQDGNLSGTNYLNQSDAAAWAAGLTTAGFQWTLPSVSDFTSLFTQLDPYGMPGTEDNKYGPTVYFGTGPNDYASNVQMIYWTNSPTQDFNFNYGYGGTAMSGDPYYAWAVDENAPAIPEPASVVLLITGIAGIGAVHWVRSKPGRRPIAIG